MTSETQVHPGMRASPDLCWAEQQHPQPASPSPHLSRFQKCRKDTGSLTFCALPDLMWPLVLNWPETWIAHLHGKQRVRWPVQGTTDRH